MENQYQLQHNTVNLNAEKAEKEIIQLREKITMLNGELLISQDANSQQKVWDTEWGAEASSTVC